MLHNVLAWVLDRASLSKESLAAFNKGLPKGVGWLNTLGSVAFTLIVFQFVTGAILAMYYTPSVQGAHESLTYVDRELLGGALLHGLHHYGAGAVVVIVALHMLRTFFAGAYKPPRELLWILGIVLLQVVILFGFTGYLLPWDMKAFFATRVGIRIAESVPILGQYIGDLMRGGASVGQATLTRFYAIHVLLLPAVVFTVAIFIAVGIVFLLAKFRGVEAGFKADPTDPFFEPRPEWYLLSIFEFLHIMGEKAPWLPEVIPAVVLPGIGITLLALLPWLDRSKERAARKRLPFVGAMYVGIAGVIGLTVIAYGRAPKNSTPETSLWGVVTHEGERPPSAAEVAAGEEVFVNHCMGCHKAFGNGGTVGPDLSLVGRRRRYEYFVAHVRNPQAHVKTSTMPAFTTSDLSDAELQQIAAFLARLPGEAPPQSATGGDDAANASGES